MKRRKVLPSSYNAATIRSLHLIGPSMQGLLGLRCARGHILLGSCRLAPAVRILLRPVMFSSRRIH